MVGGDGKNNRLNLNTNITMKKWSYIPFVVSLALIIGCVPKTRETELLEKITSLEVQLEECLMGAEKIHGKMKIAFSDKDYEACKSLYEEMRSRHPDSELMKEVGKMYSEAIAEEKAIQEEKRKAEEAAKEAKLQALKKLKKKHDDVAGITWYHQPFFTHYYNRWLTSIYIGQKPSNVWLRLRMSYNGSDWIFFEKAYLSYDGVTQEIVFDKYDDKDTDSDSGIWEWIDVTPDKTTIAFLRDFCKSPNAKMRFKGKYTKDRKLTYNERKGIEMVLAGYDVLVEENK